MQAGQRQINKAEQNMFPSVLWQQADFDVYGRERVELKAKGGAGKGKELSGWGGGQCGWSL